MKCSRYNFVFPLEGDKYLAYNALTNGLAVVDGRCGQALAAGSLEALASFPEELRSQLQRGGFLIPDELDERDVVRFRLRALQYASERVGLTVAPTLACNLACRYCFESCFRGSMDTNTQEALVRFTRSLLPPKGGSLDITWYGGEPLLAFPVIEQLTEKFQALCGEVEATYGASIITNGTLLTGKVAAKLKELQVSSAQVTLDGPPEVHDQRRPFRSGAPSFARIVANLQEAVEFLPISLRINVDRHNWKQAVDFVGWMAKQSWFDSEKVGVHFGYVRKYTPSCGCGLEEMLKPEEFHTLTDQLAESLVGLGFQPPYPDLAGTCTATSAKSFVVGPQGELYRCWNHIGEPNMVVGTVWEEIRPHPTYLKYMMAGFEEDPECLECRFLPLCAGGCVDIRIKSPLGFLPGKDCASWRYSLERRLANYYRWWWQNQQQEANEV